MRTYGFKLTGLTAFLMHHDSIENNDKLIAWRKDPANKSLSTPGDDRTPAWTWMAYLYEDGKHIALPSDNLMSCLRKAGTQMSLKGKTTFKEMTQSGMITTTEFCVFKNGGKQIPMSAIQAMESLTFEEQAEQAKKLGFQLWGKRARIGQAKHIRIRPRFDSWTVEGEISVIEDAITDKILKQMFDIAGNVGLGDWRPGCKTPGPYGRFTAKVS
jgi:hypothetical protein